MKMGKLRISSTFCSLLLLLTACSTSKHGVKSSAIMPGTWQSTPIVIDGDCTDWPSPYPNYDAKAMVAYATSNDKENLYITMQTGDPLTQVKILKQGMTVSIDTSGQRDATFNINYPLQNDDDLSELFSQGDRQKKDGSPQLSRQFEQKLEKSAENSIQFSIDGFGTCNGGYLVSQTLPCGVTVKVSIDEYKQLVWEAVVPFKAIFDRESITATWAGKPISVSFLVKGFKNPSAKNSNNSSNMGNTGMGGGGMGAGGMGGGGMGAGGRSNSAPIGAGSGSSSKVNPMQRLYESSRTWKHFRLAWK
jgi:hypothetical protein